MSEELHIDSILPSKGDVMVCIAEEGQELLPSEHPVTDEELING